ncbi:MAG: carbohydrate ABC transporter permease [archaeon YNP-WB-062]|jgi:multiple sugar transport system permease protein|nr:carbohydrate ABC transporter permease [Candidatus Culexarchaeum yellowstonense]
MELRSTNRKNLQEVIGDIGAYIILSIFGVIMLLPFLWMVSTSLKPPDEVFTFPPEFIPKHIAWDNYRRALEQIPFGRFFFNSFYIAITVTIGQLFTSFLAGYAFARLRFSGRDILFLIYLATMMVPLQVRLIPLYIMMRNFHWINTHYALIIPALTSAWGTFLARQFMLTIPKELDEAARIDGCNYIDIVFRIILPVSKPLLATLGIFVFIGEYNSFLWPLIAINSISLKTIPLGLIMFQERIYLETPWNYVMAASTVSVLPLLTIFILGQKYYVRGIVTSGLKG